MSACMDHIQSEPAGRARAGELETDSASDRSVGEARESLRDRLDYLAAMIIELRDMARCVPQSSLPIILDAASTEAQLQLARHVS